MNSHLVFSGIANHLAEMLNVSCGVGEPQTNAALPYLFVWGPLPVPGAAPLTVFDENLMVQVVAQGVPEVNKLAAQTVAALDDTILENIAGLECLPLRVTHTTAAQTESQLVEPLSDMRPAWLTVTVRFRARKV